MCMLKGETNEILWGGGKKKTNTHETSYHATHKEMEPAALKEGRARLMTKVGFSGGFYLSLLFAPSATTHITEKCHQH